MTLIAILGLFTAVMTTADPVHSPPTHHVGGGDDLDEPDAASDRDSVTEHEVTKDGQRIRYRATAGIPTVRGVGRRGAGRIFS